MTEYIQCKKCETIMERRKEGLVCPLCDNKILDKPAKKTAKKKTPGKKK